MEGWWLLELTLIRLAIAINIGFAISTGSWLRHDAQVAGWSAGRVRAITVSMWMVAAGIAIGWAAWIPQLAVAMMAFVLIGLFGQERIAAWIRSHPDPRHGAWTEVHRIFQVIATASEPDDLEGIERDLAALHEWTRPETFEFIQLARSLVIAWRDGGPRQHAREERWSSRMVEITDGWRQRNQAGRLSALERLGDQLHSELLDQARWLAFAAGLALGWSVLGEPTRLLAVPVLVVGWEFAWIGARAWPVLVGAATGMIVGIIPPDALSGSSEAMATVLFIAAGFLVAAWWLARMRIAEPRKPALRLVGLAPTHDGSRGENTDDFGPPAR